VLPSKLTRLADVRFPFSRKFLDWTEDPGNVGPIIYKIIITSCRFSSRVFQSLDGQGDGVSVDLNSVTEATLNQDGQIILTGEDGQGKTISFTIIE
jgi:hypothetical protein